MTSTWPVGHWKLQWWDLGSLQCGSWQIAVRNCCFCTICWANTSSTPPFLGPWAAGISFVMTWPLSSLTSTQPDDLSVVTVIIGGCISGCRSSPPSSLLLFSHGTHIGKVEPLMPCPVWHECFDRSSSRICRWLREHFENKHATPKHEYFYCKLKKRDPKYLRNVWFRDATSGYAGILLYSIFWTKPFPYIYIYVCISVLHRLHPECWWFKHHLPNNHGFSRFNHIVHHPWID